MGSGIAQVFAQKEGYSVVLCDITEEFAANGKKKIQKGLKKNRKRENGSKRSRFDFGKHYYGSERKVCGL